MACSLQFGRDGNVSLDPPSGSWVAENRHADLTPLADPGQAVRAALADPIDFPALNLMILPDDEVAIALEPGLACAAELVAGTIEAVIEVGVPPELIRVVRAPKDNAVTDKQLFAKIDKGIAERIQIFRHDPTNREDLSFLGASKDEHAVYVNRTLCDAAVVLPLGMQQGHDEIGCLGVHHSWFPTFADEETQNRFTAAMASLSDKKIKKAKAECQEASWMLGVQMVVQVVPAGDSGALQVLAGAPPAVWKRGNELAEQAWQMNVDRRASLVVAAIGGGPEQQTWSNIVRTIDTALEAVEVDGAIAVCSQLATKPGPALRRLAGSENFESADRAIQKKAYADTVAASRLNRALQRARVYLLSKLDENDVEDLGMAYVSDVSEIAKLSTQHDSCLVLQNAQHVSISLDAKDES